MNPAVVLRPQSAAAKRRDLLKIKIRALFEFNNEEYGYLAMYLRLKGLVPPSTDSR